MIFEQNLIENLSEFLLILQLKKGLLFIKFSTSKNHFPDDKIIN